MTTDSRAKLKSWLESGAASLHKLTYPQRELWEAAALDARDAANSICCTMRLRGILTEEAARQALYRVVERHEVMRLSILPGKAGPLQLVRKSGELAIEFRDLAAGDTDAEKAFFAQPFDLVVGPLYRILVLRIAPDDHLILFAMHHAIGDGWSWGIFAQDLVVAYLSFTIGDDRPLPALPQSYTQWGAVDSAYWSPGLLQERGAYWRPKLKGLPRLWNETISGRDFIRRTTVLPATFAAKVRKLAIRHGATLYSALLAGFQVAFSRWAGTDEVVVGSPVANRRGPATGEIMGSFASMLPIRYRIERRASFDEHLRSSHRETTQCLSHAMPFVELVALSDETREPGFNPLYEVRFALQNQPVPHITAPGFEAELTVKWTGTPRFQIACEITEIDDALEIVWSANARLFAAEDIGRLARHFEAALERACDAPDAPVSGLGE